MEKSCILIENFEFSLHFHAAALITHLLNADYNDRNNTDAYGDDDDDVHLHAATLSS